MIEGGKTSEQNPKYIKPSENGIKKVCTFRKNESGNIKPSEKNRQQTEG